MKQVIKIIIQPKSDDDWRAFAIAKDSDGNTWELRGYGESLDQAKVDVEKRVNDEEQHWDIYGYMI